MKEMQKLCDDHFGKSGGKYYTNGDSGPSAYFSRSWMAPTAGGWWGASGASRLWPHDYPTGFSSGRSVVGPHILFCPLSFLILDLPIHERSIHIQHSFLRSPFYGRVFTSVAVKKIKIILMPKNPILYHPRIFLRCVTVNFPPKSTRRVLFFYGRSQRSSCIFPPLSSFQCWMPPNAPHPGWGNPQPSSSKGPCIQFFSIRVLECQVVTRKGIQTCGWMEHLFKVTQVVHITVFQHFVCVCVFWFGFRGVFGFSHPHHHHPHMFPCNYYSLRLFSPRIYCMFPYETHFVFEHYELTVFLSTNYVENPTVLCLILIKKIFDALCLNNKFLVVKIYC